MLTLALCGIGHVSEHKHAAPWSLTPLMRTLHTPQWLCAGSITCCITDFSFHRNFLYFEPFWGNSIKTNTSCYTTQINPGFSQIPAGSAHLSAAVSHLRHDADSLHSSYLFIFILFAIVYYHWLTWMNVIHIICIKLCMLQRECY